MSNGFKFGQHATAYVVKAAHNKTMKPTKSTFGIGGCFRVTCYSKDGTLKWEDTAKNGVTKVGLDATLDVFFNATDSVGGVGSAGWSWALGVIDDAGFASLSEDDTHASHSGWNEFTDYTVSASSSIRGTWAANPALNQQVLNPTFIDYDVLGIGSVHGVFIVGGSISGVPSASDANSKSSTDGTPLLWATAEFDSGSQPVTGGDILRIIYDVTAQSV